MAYKCPETKVFSGTFDVCFHEIVGEAEENEYFGLLLRKKYLETGMIKRHIFLLLLCALIIALLSGCMLYFPDGDVVEENTDDRTHQMEESNMKFNFEVMDDPAAYTGGSFLMNFEEMATQESAALIEGKLLTVFGEPADRSDNYENSFNYYISATAEDGRSTMLNVYGMGVVHIGATHRDDMAKQAAVALIAHVNAAVPTDYERTVYYLDYNLQVDISVKDGAATVAYSEIPDEKADALFEQFY